MEKIKVLLVEDDPDWIFGIKNFFEGHESIDLLSAVSSIEDCFLILHNNHIDIVIMDIMLNDYDSSGLDATLDITIEFPDVKVIMLSSLDEDEIFNEAFMNGAFEYVYKPDFEQLPDVIVNAMQNDSHKYGERLRKLVFEKKKSLLSGSDCELLKLVLAGKTQAEIAKELDVSLAAVKKHIGRIMKKFTWQQSSKELADRCYKWGLLDN